MPCSALQATSARVSGSRAGQWCNGFPELGEGGVQLAGRLGQAEGQLGAEGEHGVVEGRVLQGEADIGPGEFS